MRGRFVLLLIILLLVGACGEEKPGETTNEDVLDTNTLDSESNWKETSLKDIRTGETFTISQFEKPILLESFAVWCPTCTRQQTEIKKLHEEVGNEIISISLDTDPNEDESKVKEHLERNGFNWYYAISPEDMTQDIIAEFGLKFVNAPQAPVVLICNGESQFLDRGVKTSDELLEKINTVC